MPARPAALLSVSALAIGGALAAGPAYAVPADEHSGSAGKATAVAARADLGISVEGVGDVAVKKALSDLSAPGDAQQTLLTAEVNGANKGQPTTLVKAKVAHSSVTADAHRSVGDVKLVGLRAYAPGLPDNPLLSADLLTATASCETGKKPTAKAALADNVTVLGKPIPVNGPGDQHVEVPGVGTVDLVLENATTTDSTGAATALRLKYTVTPAKLGVVKASGEIVLAEATCAMPSASGADHDGSDGNGSHGDGSGSGVAEGGSSDGQSSAESAGSKSAEGAENAVAAGNQPNTQTGDDGLNLAETGGNSATPVIAGAGGALILGGAAAVYLMRRRRTTQNN
ncbi:SCO1860 family LAETG-anchored protein [Streptomyces sp. V4I2]|uniref:SCO1860 family LAETG-anchored protein n=1 Tax=Streptomyces sp. V4I2 TaxID=3042280 RepID=UPI0027892897|nr:SCO1860 family LAETG-anchored protein [Streptomyces sp. V4I2]MDQ1051807.1 LPXTG-motif cell wall-anchored protein [Streptomyces sp. V4I2]